VVVHNVFNVDLQKLDEEIASQRQHGCSCEQCWPGLQPADLRFV